MFACKIFAIVLIPYVVVNVRVHIRFQIRILQARKATDPFGFGFHNTVSKYTVSVIAV
jgi:hypothetical protein